MVSTRSLQSHNTGRQDRPSPNKLCLKELWPRCPDTWAIVPLRQRSITRQGWRGLNRYKIMFGPSSNDILVMHNNSQLCIYVSTYFIYLIYLLSFNCTFNFNTIYNLIYHLIYLTYLLSFNCTYLSLDLNFIYQLSSIKQPNVTSICTIIHNGILGNCFHFEGVCPHTKLLVPLKNHFVPPQTP